MQIASIHNLAFIFGWQVKRAKHIIAGDFLLEANDGKECQQDYKLNEKQSIYQTAGLVYHQRNSWGRTCLPLH